MPAIQYKGLTIVPPLDDLPSLEDVELAYIDAVLAHCGGDKRAAAVTLGICLKTLYTKLGRIEAERKKGA